ncbi:MAG: aldehyde dehydrogenase family protein, partial [Phycisphaerae bacterium]
ARCVVAGESCDNLSGGYFFPPTVFADVPPDARIAQEECMAPILCVIRADTFEQAVEIANATPYGLVGGVYSRSSGHIEMAKRRLQVGMLYINRKITLSRVDRQPFGGMKMSGLGTKTGGPDMLQQFMIPKTISENTMRHGFTPAQEQQGETPKRRKVEKSK